MFIKIRDFYKDKEKGSKNTGLIVPLEGIVKIEEDEKGIKVFIRQGLSTVSHQEIRLTKEESDALMERLEENNLIVRSNITDTANKMVESAMEKLKELKETEAKILSGIEAPISEPTQKETTFIAGKNPEMGFSLREIADVNTAGQKDNDISF